MAISPLAFGNVALLIKGEDEGSKRRIKIGPTTVRGRIIEGFGGAKGKALGSLTLEAI